MRKKLIKEGDVSTHPIWRNEECAISSTRRIVRLAKKYNKKSLIIVLFMLFITFMSLVIVLLIPE